MIMIKKLHSSFTVPENHKKIGLFRIFTAIFGGFILSYLGMVLMAKVLPFNKSDLAVISLFFNTLMWTLTMLWIIVSPTKLSALLRFLIPTLIFSISIYILY